VYCKDFEYDGQRLSDYECIVCHILEGGDASAINIGSQITFNTLPIASGNKFKLMSTQYAETYTATFEICKYSCLDSDNNFFTQEEVSCLMRWLNKKRFKKFKMVYEDGELADVYYNASFNVNPITYYGDIIGLQLTLQTDAPFGYYEEVEVKDYDQILVLYFPQNGTTYEFEDYFTSVAFGSVFDLAEDLVNSYIKLAKYNEIEPIDFDEW
jgi:hypothetical protein